MSIEGGCRCGAVRFRLEADPIGARACWCRDCQYIAAGSATINVVFPTAGFTVTGAVADYVETADSGEVMHRRFCPVCGTPLFSDAQSRPHVVIVRAGALDDPAIGAPKGAIWTASAPAWAHIDPDLPALAGQPPPVEGCDNLLRSAVDKLTVL